MTNEEAINAIKLNYPPENYSRLREALDMAMLMLAAESKSLIPWIKYDPANPPQFNQQFLVFSNGKMVYTAELHAAPDAVVWLEDCNYSRLGNITHYAHINLPEVGEETDNA